MSRASEDFKRYFPTVEMKLTAFLDRTYLEQLTRDKNTFVGYTASRALDSDLRRNDYQKLKYHEDMVRQAGDNEGHFSGTQNKIALRRPDEINKETSIDKQVD